MSVFKSLLRSGIALGLVSLLQPLLMFGAAKVGQLVITDTNVRPISALDLLRIRDITGLQISPDGKRVAYVVSQAVYETNGYQTTLFVVGTQPGSAPINLGGVGEPHWSSIGEYLDISPQWSPDSQAVTYLVRTEGRHQIWRWSAAGSKPEALTDKSDDVDSYDLLPDGRAIRFTVVEPIKAEDLRRISERGILYGDNLGQGNSINASKNQSVMSQVVSAMPRTKQVFIYDLTTGSQRKPTDEEEGEYKNYIATPDFLKKNILKISRSPDGMHVGYVSLITDAQKAPRYSYAVYTSGADGSHTLELLPPANIPISDLWWNKGGSEIYLAKQEVTGTIILGIPAQGGSPHQVMGSSDYLHDFSVDKDVTLAACLRENAVTPAELLLINLRDGTSRPLANVNSEFQGIRLSPATLLEWTNKYGDKTFGYLVKPINYQPGKRYPLIVTTYRARGFLRGGTGDEYPIQLFAANGFAVLAFNAASERLTKAGDIRTAKLRWYSPMASLETSLKLLTQMGIVDSNRAGLTGLSYGTQITNFTISHSGLFHAAASSAISSVDPIFYYLERDGVRQVYRAYGLNEPPSGKGATVWREISSALNVKRVTAALLVQVADSEYLYGLQFYSALKDHQKPVEMFIYPDEAHIKNQPKHRYEIYQRNLDWFNFWLQGKEDPDPAKAEQYKRWHQLKADWEKTRKSTSASVMSH